MKCISFLLCLLFFISCSIMRTAKQIATISGMNKEVCIAAVNGELIVPFVYNDQRRIIIQLKSITTGNVYNFIYDCGAFTTLYDHSPLAQELTFFLYDKQITTVGYGGESVSTGYYEGSFELAGATFKNVKLDKTVGLSKNENKKCATEDDEVGISGLLGFDFFFGNFITIDYKNSVLILSENPPKDLETYQVKLNANTEWHYQFKGKLGEEKIEFMLDTGDPGLLRVNDRLNNVNKYLLSNYSQMESSMKMGLGESVKTSITIKGYAKPLNLEGLAGIDSLSTDLSMVELMGVSIKAVTLGNEFLSKFTVVIDTKNQLIYLQPLQLKLTFPKSKLFVGVRSQFNAKEKTFNIVFIETSSEAYKKGVRAGNEIVTLNGKDVKQTVATFSEDQLCECVKSSANLNALFGCDKNCPKEVRLNDGRVVTL